MKEDNEFYIGWQTEAPPGFARTVRLFLLGLCLIVPATAALIVLFQHEFAGSTFEFGKKTELSGRYGQKPFPFLSIDNGTDAAGNAVVQNVLLVAQGKFGFSPDPGSRIADGDYVDITGFLIYHDGKTAMEVHGIKKRESATPSAPAAPRTELGVATLRGEITDPKCLLGVMKPGNGKPHLDCAVRCIAGGIPPVLRVANAQGETEYYLLAGPDGEPVNDRLLAYVGGGVELCGRIARENDWLVLYADPAAIRRISKLSLNTGSRCN